MSASDPNRVQAMFLQLVELSDAERPSALDRECGDDLELRQRLEALLKAHDEADSLLDQRPVDPAETSVEDAPGPDESSPSSVAGTVDHHPNSEPDVLIAGRYTLQEKIGEGGMGEVWVARQTEPVKRKVALKLIKAGMDSRAVLQRFEQERQALAMMDHPNIAKVLDAGLTPTGQPFFVMELVNGLALTTFCDEAKLTLRERLELFAPICQAVQHAHQKGIVHRDLKPANILVTMIDGRPTPKVIDFGVAKAIAGKLTDESMSTQFGSIIGTLEYMSPEQAGFSGQDVDTRADIYSLGVILYESLTGLRPLDAARLRNAALTEMIRIIREDEPSKPSTRLSSDASLPSLAAMRRIEPRRLTALLRGELDWVVMKCLEKHRDRRYETANALSRDIQRYLADEPVEARPPSAGYRIRKFVRRHKLQVIAASLVLLALLAGMAGTTWGLLEADRRRLEAETRRGQAEASEKLAGERLIQIEAEKKKAEEEKAIAVSVKDFLQNKLLGQADVTQQADALLKAGGLSAEAKQNPTIRELLDRAALEMTEGKIEANFPNQPLLQAEILHTVGNTYRGIGESERAIGFLQRSFTLRNAELGSEHPDTILVMGHLAEAYKQAGNLDLALPLYEKSLKIRTSKLGPDHPLTLADMANLAWAYLAAGKLDLALPLFEESLKLTKAKLGADHPDTLHGMGSLAMAYHSVGKPELAVPLMEESIKLMKAKLGPEHPDTLISMDNLAVAYLAAGKPDLALPLGVETLRLKKAKFGPDHPDTLTSMNNLAKAYEDAGKRDLAVPLYEESLKRSRAKLGPDHPSTLIAMTNLAAAYQATKRLALALPLLEEALKVWKAKLGPDHPNTLHTMYNLAVGYHASGKLDLALPLYEESFRLHKAKLGPDHPNTLHAMHGLAEVYFSAKQFDRSVSLFEETLKLRESQLGRNHPATQRTVISLGNCYMIAGRLQEAIPLLEEGYQAKKKYPALPEVGPALLEAIAKVGDSAGAARLLDELLAEARKQSPEDSPKLADQLAALGSALLTAKAFTEAEPLIRESLILREKTQPDDWATFNSQSLLGGALLGLKKYDEAEPLLIKGYEGMKQREQTIPARSADRIPEALDRLIELYTALEKPDEAAKWQAERAKHPAASPPQPKPK